MKPKKDDAVQIIADGRERALAGAQKELLTRRAEIKARIEASYAQQIAVAGVFRRIWLNFRMNWEIKSETKREEKRLAPRDALYFSQ